MHIEWMLLWATLTQNLSSQSLTILKALAFLTRKNSKEFTKKFD
jgi:hypothetical protein